MSLTSAHVSHHDSVYVIPREASPKNIHPTTNDPHTKKTIRKNPFCCRCCGGFSHPYLVPFVNCQQQASREKALLASQAASHPSRWCCGRRWRLLFWRFLSAHDDNDDDDSHNKSTTKEKTSTLATRETKAVSCLRLVVLTALLVLRQRPFLLLFTRIHGPTKTRRI